MVCTYSTQRWFLASLLLLYSILASHTRHRNGFWSEATMLVEVFLLMLLGLHTRCTEMVSQDALPGSSQHF